ncbi:DedA family protein [Arsenicicoccus dermatophilus]|uniref:DedA family protein n=1 Tax=Arsenicicoccus dermatophilus TaxID=1076331 RepID=UPI001F4CDA82|nr:VTT domain-containing protein [Arsenicicoccus dermatophilus]MCH8611866.1 VTT domain-containing protein [Arsenicicoccus dermatophilus]
MIPHALSSLQWMDPQYLLDHYGTAFFWVSMAIVFVECGLLFPILPGDSLLFAIGMFIKRGDVHMSLPLALVLLSAAAFGGNVVGYEIGRALGGSLYHRDGRVLKKKYFDQTIDFFDKYGNKALVIGRFVPIVRTFITVVAGVGQMDRRRFFTWSAVGAVLWACSVTLAGYLLGGIPAVHDNLEAAILLIVALSLLPMVFEWLMHRRRQSRARLLDDEVPVTRGSRHRR